MKISGFSFVRNGIKLYYPVIESIKSILPICSEFIITVGEGDEDDATREQIMAINDDRIKVIDTKWDETHFHKGRINAVQTNMALQECSGDWCFYLQADEVIHEKYLPIIQRRCDELLGEKEVEGLLFDYKHFWGDYDHFLNSHGWYSKEIRIIRNGLGIESWESAQSFRKAGKKLRVAKVNAEVYHYGWVRPPHFMQNKRKALDSVHWGTKASKDFYEKQPQEFDYGPLNKLAKFKGTHPNVMQEKVEEMFWSDKLQYNGKPKKDREPHKHEKFKYRFLTFIENYLLGGNRIGEFKNYILLKK